MAKAYSGLSDAEILELDRWIRAHTVEKFGPVRQVELTQVFELAYEGIAASNRHKSGIALRFPRILRHRTDKPASEADTLANLQAVLREHSGGQERYAEPAAHQLDPPVTSGAGRAAEPDSPTTDAPVKPAQSDIAGPT